MELEIFENGCNGPTIERQDSEEKRQTDVGFSGVTSWLNQLQISSDRPMPNANSKISQKVDPGPSGKQTNKKI